MVLFFCLFVFVLLVKQRRFMFEQKKMLSVSRYCLLIQKPLRYVKAVRLTVRDDKAVEWMRLAVNTEIKGCLIHS